MTSVIHPLFANADLAATFTYDDVTLKPSLVHADNFLSLDQDLQMVAAQQLTFGGHTYGVDEVIITVTCKPGPNDFPIPPAKQPTLTLNAKGKPDGVYFRTA